MGRWGWESWASWLEWGRGTGLPNSPVPCPTGHWRREGGVCRGRGWLGGVCRGVLGEQLRAQVPAGREGVERGVSSPVGEVGLAGGVARQAGGHQGGPSYGGARGHCREVRSGGPGGWGPPPVAAREGVELGGTQAAGPPGRPHPPRPTAFPASRGSKIHPKSCPRASSAAEPDPLDFGDGCHAWGALRMMG